MATSDNPEATDELFGLGTLMSDLKRLESKAMAKGCLIAATLIGAAAEAVADEMVDGLSTQAQADRPETATRLDELLGSDPQRLQ
ncbi:MAG: hypothetical protein MI785_25405 [Kiloniellales bacterium]|nr:hypothetical protein [Kiloniellales bacterium]